MQAKNKPSFDQLQKKFPNMINVKIPKEQVNKINMKQLNQSLQQAYKLSQRDHLDPSHVLEKLKNNDKVYTQLYQRLRTFAVSIKCTQRMKQALADKMIAKTAKQLGVPMRQAMCMILMDDFFDTVRSFGGNILSTLKNFYSNNKQLVHDTLAGILTYAFPQAAPIITGVHKAIGGPVLSQHPTAIDMQYIGGALGQIGRPICPGPRQQNHYMYQMAATVQIPIITLPDGTALVCICPYSCVLGAWAANSKYLPFVHVANNAAPYSTAGTYTQPGPFFSQFSSIINYGIDTLKVSYINTQASIACKGKVISSFFYQPPNNSFVRNTITGLYNTNTINVTDNQLLQNQGYFRRFSNVECQKSRHLGSYVIQQSLDKCVSSYQFENIGSQLYATMPFIIIKFTNCNPSTGIGSLFIQVSCSIQPTAAMRNIYKVTPRGSYQGVYRAFKQARKLGLPLQFMTAQQIEFLCRPRFQQIQFPIGQGIYVPLPGFQKLPQKQGRDGMCIHDSLQAIGVQNDLPAWSALSDLLPLSTRVLYNLGNQFVYYSDLLQASSYVYIDYVQRHATAVKISNLPSLLKYLTANKFSLVKYQNGQYIPVNYLMNVKSRAQILQQLLKSGVQQNPGPLDEQGQVPALFKSCCPDLKIFKFMYAAPFWQGLMQYKPVCTYFVDAIKTCKQHKMLVLNQLSVIKQCLLQLVTFINSLMQSSMQQSSSIVDHNGAILLYQRIMMLVDIISMNLQPGAKVDITVIRGPYMLVVGGVFNNHIRTFVFRGFDKQMINDKQWSMQQTWDIYSKYHPNMQIHKSVLKHRFLLIIRTNIDCNHFATRVRSEKQDDHLAQYAFKKLVKEYSPFRHHFAQSMAFSNPPPHFKQIQSYLVDDNAIQLLKGGIQPNPGPIAVESEDDQQAADPQPM